MKPQVLIATTNQGKKQELKNALALTDLKDKIEFLTLSDIKTPLEDVEETGQTFKENALLKAQYYFNQTKYAVIADDSGLCVPALNGEPGVFSARYSGKDANSQKNIDLLLSKLANNPQREAYFITSMVFYQSDHDYIDVEGRCYGSIIDDHPKGQNGFGYDPIFYLKDHKKTMAELTPDQKIQISHRTQALHLLVPHLIEWLNNQ